MPVERVRVDTETAAEEPQVSEEVRKEHIGADGVYPDNDRTGARSDVEQRRG